MEIYTGEGKKLEDAILSVAGDSLEQNHCLYQDTYYNSVKVAETPLDKKTEVRGIMSCEPTEDSHLICFGKLKNLRKVCSHFGGRMTSFCRKDIKVRMIFTVFNAKVVSANKNDRRMGDVKNLIALFSTMSIRKESAGFTNT
jgi:hypothetical protein